MVESAEENFNVCNESMRSSSPEIVSTELSACNNLISDSSLASYSSLSSAAISVDHSQGPAEHERSHTARSLSSGNDLSSMYITEQSDQTFITLHENRPCQSTSSYLLDLGLRCKGFRMGHLNIQGISNKIDQVRLLLESDKNQIHVLGLSETKLNTLHPDSAFSDTL